MNDSPPSPDEQQFIPLFVRHEPALRAFVRPLVPTWDDLDEVLQQTSLVLLRKYAEFEPGTDFLAWACTIARFEVMTYRRSRARDRHVFSEELVALLAEEASDETLRREDERRALEACLQRLPPPQRELISRCYGSGRRINEVADSLGRSATSLYKALNRIRLVLLECVERRLAGDIA